MSISCGVKNGLYYTSNGSIQKNVGIGGQRLVMGS